MSLHEEYDSPTESTDSGTDRPTDDLPAQVALLEAENERLREEYRRLRRTRHRRTALGLLAVGGVALLAAALFPGARSVLLALGGTGVFAGLLTYYLAPDRFVSADVGERSYRAFAETGTSIVAELALTADRIYLPAPTAADPERLFVPQRSNGDLPDGDALKSLFIVDEACRGVAFYPTGAELMDEFERGLAGELGASPDVLADQLGDGLVEQFELVRRAVPTASEPGRLTVGITDSAYGPVDRFDHPVVSFLAVGAARALARPIAVDTVDADDERIDYLITCSWEQDAETESENDGEEESRA